MGRNKLDGNEARNVKLNFRVRKAQGKQVDDIAEFYGKSKSDILNAMLSFCVGSERFEKHLYDLFGNIG